MSLKRSSLENYVLLLLYIDKMNYTKFKVSTFLKNIRPFCKTEHLAFKRLHVRIRGSKVGICIQVHKECFVVTQNGSVHEFTFYCETQKTLLKKLLKHNLLTP